MRWEMIEVCPLRQPPPLPFPLPQGFINMSDLNNNNNNSTHTKKISFRKNKSLVSDVMVH